MSAIIPYPESSSAAVEYSRLEAGPTPAILVSRSSHSVKSALSLYWNVLACKFAIRAGQVVSLRSDRLRKTRIEKYQLIGFGFSFSVYLPSYFRRKLCIARCTFQIMLISQTKNALHCNLDFAKTVPPDAEIFRSARGGSIDNVKRLLSLRKASAKDITIFGTTLLHSASKSGNMQLVRLLIQEGADVNAQDEDGESPLHGAMAKSDNYNIARTLIENGADLSSQAIDGKTPFHNIFNNTISQILIRDDWIETMLPDSEAMSITHFLAWSSTSTAAIFQRGHSYDDADLLSTDTFGRTCVHLAASRGNLEVLSYLIGRVSLEDVEKKDLRGRRPFHYAVESSRAAGIIDILMKRGCNIHAADNAGRNALHWAARSNNSEAVKKLIASVDGEKLLLSDTNGRMPSAEVSQTRAPALYKYLRDRELSSQSGALQSNNPRIQYNRANHGAASGSSGFLEIVGILIVIVMMLLGISD